MLRRTKNISLVVIAAFAAAACEESKSNTEDPNQEIKHCVDKDGVVQDESACANVSDNHHPTPDGGTTPVSHGSGGHGGFFWYYGGARSTPGTRVSGGSYSPSPGKVYSPPSRAPSPPSISRGGFGGTGGGHAGGGGE